MPRITTVWWVWDFVDCAGVRSEWIVISQLLPTLVQENGRGVPQMVLLPPSVESVGSHVSVPVWHCTTAEILLWLHLLFLDAWRDSPRADSIYVHISQGGLQIRRHPETPGVHLLYTKGDRFIEIESNIVSSLSTDPDTFEKPYLSCSPGTDANTFEKPYLNLSCSPGTADANTFEKPYLNVSSSSAGVEDTFKKSYITINVESPDVSINRAFFARTSRVKKLSLCVRSSKISLQMQVANWVSVQSYGIHAKVATNSTPWTNRPYGTHCHLLPPTV